MSVKHYVFDTAYYFLFAVKIFCGWMSQNTSNTSNLRENIHNGSLTSAKFLLRHAHVDLKVMYIAIFNI